MPATDRRYTDKDVRSDDNLHALAVTYAKDYMGDFEFMVAAHELARATHSLPVGVARGVLNCMRADAAIAHLMPAPASSATVLPTETGGATVTHLASVRPLKSAVKTPIERPKPDTIDVNVTVRPKYGIATGRNAFKTHIVDGAICRYSVRNLGGSQLYRWGRFHFITFRVQWLCRTAWNDSPWPNLFEELPEDADRCRVCFEKDAYVEPEIEEIPQGVFL